MRPADAAQPHVDVIDGQIVQPRIVLAHGCFDLLHLGHIRHLQEARKLGDRLVVSVTSDGFVAKGMGRPHFTAAHRAEALSALGCVDEVVINNGPDACAVIERLRPAVYVKGIDYLDKNTDGLRRETAAVEAVGGRIEFTKTEKWSSSRLLNSERFPDDVQRYLEAARKSFAKEKILAAFDFADSKEIAFVGETIIDEYRYVQGLGRASKELMLATVETGFERFDGGVMAAAKHGDWPNGHCVTVPHSITKTRFVDADFNRKLFDVYSARKIKLDEAERDDFRAVLHDVAGTVDIVVVLDFGHGLLGRFEREGLCTGVPFLAVNAQTNAGNFGFNPITNYARADYICVDNPEARIAVGMSEEADRDVIRALTGKIACKRFLVTHGRNGSTFSGQGTFGAAPALATGGIDTMGAGDAVMAVTAPLVAAGLDMANVALVGNIVGAIKVSIVGHRRHVTRKEIIETLEALLA